MTENEIISKEAIENFVQNLAIARQGVKDYFDKIIKLEDSSYSIKVVFYLFVAMKCKQVVEGVLGIIECLLPAYEEPKEEDGAEKK